MQGFGKYWLKNLASDISVRCTFKYTTGKKSIKITGALHLKIEPQSGDNWTITFLLSVSNRIETRGAAHRNINILSLSASPTLKKSGCSFTIIAQTLI
ncbi:MAG: hypothetical protein CVT92_11195 [Bacteroidetes bacterium HGW-Bacteroidetes-1]|nr:MAG: hypothetical protein CVT92_11195 [Bacteroidetes bacterium HGW-Bacteroidetes-1]